jgi:hypothetical protein
MGARSDFRADYRPGREGSTAPNGTNRRNGTIICVGVSMADPNQVAGIRRAGEVERRFAFVFPLPTALLPFYFFSFGGNTFFSLPKKHI